MEEIYQSMEFRIDQPPAAHSIAPAPSATEDGVTMVHALGAPELRKFAAPVRRPVEDFLAAQAILTCKPLDPVYDVVRVTVVTERPQDRAEIPTDEMPVVQDGTEEMGAVGHDPAELSRLEVAARQAEYQAFCHAREAALANPPPHPMHLPLVRYAVQQLADSGHLGARDLLERSGDHVPARVGMIVARAAATWPQIAPLANRLSTWV
jgi:hypothetical protein